MLFQKMLILQAAIQQMLFSKVTYSQSWVDYLQIVIRIILYHNDLKNPTSKKTCSIHCNLQHEVH